jgi:hypothetical protein
MYKRISLYDLDAVLAGRARPRATRSTTAQPRPAAASTVRAWSFDTGAPLRCEHDVLYTPVARVEVLEPPEAAPSAAPLQLGGGYSVEAFDDTDDGGVSLEAPALGGDEAEEDERLRVERSRDIPSVASPFPDGTPAPATFAKEMDAVERDLVELAGRMQTPSSPSETPTAAPDTDAEPSPPPPVPPTNRPGHAVFEEIAEGMRYATEFRLPPLPLAKVFSALDRQLDTDAASRNGTVTVPAASPPTSPSPSTEVLLRDLIDLTPPKHAGSLPSGRADVLAAAALDIRHDVQLVPQQTGYSCWAAGAAMLVGWRDKISVDPSEIARATGYWAQYAAGLNAEDTQVFHVWGLTPEAAQTYSVQTFADLLRRYGPLWVASAEPGPHVRVVTGLVGDGTATGTLLYVNDPWEQGMATFHLPNRGARYTETYQQFVDKQEALGRREIKLQGIYVAHCGAATLNA